MTGAAASGFGPRSTRTAAVTASVPARPFASTGLSTLAFARSHSPGGSGHARRSHAGLISLTTDGWLFIAPTRIPIAARLRSGGAARLVLVAVAGLHAHAAAGAAVLATGIHHPA